MEKLLELKDLKELLDRKELEELLDKSITLKISERQKRQEAVVEWDEKDISLTDLVQGWHKHWKIGLEQDGKVLGRSNKERKSVLGAVWKILEAEGKLVWVRSGNQRVQVVRGADGGKAIVDALETLKDLKELKRLRELNELKDPKAQEELKKLEELEKLLELKDLKKLLDRKELEELLDKSISLKISKKQEVVEWDEKDISWTDLMTGRHEHWGISLKQDGKALGRGSKERRTVLGAVWKILEAEEKLVWVRSGTSRFQVVRGADGGKAIEDALEELKELKELKRLRELKKLEELDELKDPKELKELKRLNELKDPKEQEKLEKLLELKDLKKLLDRKELEELLDKSISLKISKKQEVVEWDEKDISWTDLMTGRHEHWGISLKQDGKALGRGSKERRTVLGAVWKILEAEEKLVWVRSGPRWVQVVRGEDGGEAIVNALNELKELKKLEDPKAQEELKELKRLRERNELKDPKAQEKLKKLEELEKLLELKDLKELLDRKELEKLLDKSITLKISERENAMTREQQQAKLKRLQDAAEQAETPEQKQKYQEQARELFAQMQPKRKSEKADEKTGKDKPINFPPRAEGR